MKYKKYFPISRITIAETLYTQTVPSSNPIVGRTLPDRISSFKSDSILSPKGTVREVIRISQTVIDTIGGAINSAAISNALEPVILALQSGESAYVLLTYGGGEATVVLVANSNVPSFLPAPQPNQVYIQVAGREPRTTSEIQAQTGARMNRDLQQGLITPLPADRDFDGRLAEGNSGSNRGADYSGHRGDFNSGGHENWC
jgi:hypothetical protein